MNQDASIILARLGVRKKLLTSLLRDSVGMWVGKDEETGLYHGHVQKVFALVPIEHAEYISQSAVNDLRGRGLSQRGYGADLVGVYDALKADIELIDTEIAWVKECGGA